MPTGLPFQFLPMAVKGSPALGGSNTWWESDKSLIQIVDRDKGNVGATHNNNSQPSLTLSAIKLRLSRWGWKRAVQVSTPIGDK